MPDPSPSSEPARTCPKCGQQVAPGDHFCEADGTPLDAPAQQPVMTCACGPGKGTDGGDGFCATCGMKLMAATPEAEGGDGDALSPATDLGAATHVGKSHATDEDAVAVGRRDRDGGAVHVLVVCDGVSSSSHGEHASKAAADAALALLLADIDQPGPFDAEASLRAATIAAHRAACEAPIEQVEGKDPPGTTYVAAVAHAGRIDVAWVGDSRAYLIGPPLADGSTLSATALTHDHSWVNLMVDSGRMTEDEATHSQWAHALVHCMGPLEDPDPSNAPEPSLGHVTAERGSRLVVCSDGLWNYAPAPEDIAALLASVPPGADGRTIAWRLVHHALAMGGHDDITVAVALL